MEPDPDVQAKRDLTYGQFDLGSLSIFSGSFINFGYWGDLEPDREITVEERLESHAELYRQVARTLELEPGNRLVELGCGMGVGAAQVVTEFDVLVTGIDRSAAQLERARTVNAGAIKALDGALAFVQGSVTDLPWGDRSVDAVFSVEVLQHVDDLAAVAREAHRVLVPGGRIAIATFFAPDGADTAQIADLLEPVATGVDIIRPVGDLAADLTAAGFTDVAVESIGDHVWRQLDRWIAQTEFRISWARNYLRCYENGMLDYYVVTARREGLSLDSERSLSGPFAALVRCRCRDRNSHERRHPWMHRFAVGARPGRLSGPAEWTRRL
ncbi:methyltransferase domain-containing protein [Glycomyces sp. NPDC049804]|uniref:class I SAM-dependent methyltransferase n=1 Tax=Glycomyces sp. NPDC049804 TaxID=3154363 RepID=UPI0034256C52